MDKPASPSDESKVHKFGNKLLPGVFLGYNQEAGGAWSGDYLVLDAAELQNAVRVSDVFVKRLRHAEVYVPQGPFRFPVAIGQIQQPGNVPQDSLSPEVDKQAEQLQSEP